MLFQENPFYLLHAHSTDGQAEISDLAEDVCFEAETDEEENSYREAENILINPRKRVFAEIFWLCGISKEESYSLINALQKANAEKNPLQVRLPKEEINALVPWNQYLIYLNHNIIVGSRSLTGDILKKMDDLYEATSINDLKQIIDGDRRKACITTIQDEIWIKEGKERVLQETLSLLREKWLVVNPLWSADLLAREVKLTEIETEFLTKMIALYNECLECKISEKEDLCYRALEQIERGNIQDGINALKRPFFDWAAIILPLNEYGIKFLDGCIPRVWKLLGRLREVAVNRHNRYHDIHTALELTNLAVEYFSKTPDVGPKFLEDQALLQRMMNEIVQLNQQRQWNKKHSFFNAFFSIKKAWNRKRLGWVAAFLLIMYFISSGGFSSSKKANSYVPTYHSSAISTQTKAPNTIFIDSKGETSYQKPKNRGTVFSMPEIRWSVREGIRIDTLKRMNLNSSGIDAYNHMVDEYNRCASEFKYRGNAYKDAKAEVEKERATIVREVQNQARNNGWIDE